MPAFIFLTDTQLTVTRSNELTPLVGFDSKFDTEPHPNTGKLIEGWKWDERTWPVELEFQNKDSAPSIWDPDNSALNAEDFQSGVGDNTDLFADDVEIVFAQDASTWSPNVEHGDYYDQETAGYLYSDSAVQQHFEEGMLVSGFNKLELRFTPKPGIKISASKWQWNRDEGRYDPAITFFKRANFTGERDAEGVRLSTRDEAGNILFWNASDEFHEFVVESQLTPKLAILNNNYIDEHGEPGPSALTLMEVLGIANGVDNEEFNLLFSPVVPSGLDVVSFLTDAGPHTTWHLVDKVTASGQYTLDRDLGIIRFSSGVNFHPTTGETVAAHYKSTVMVEYEPENTSDTVEAREIDLNPLGKTSAGGFVYLKREVLDPANIELTADAATISTSVYGPIFLGAATRLLAKVTSKAGDAIEGEEVTFELLNTVGGFSGGVSEISSLTNFNGVARTLFNAPRNIQALGAVTDVVGHNGSNTEITIDGTSLIGDPAGWYIYKVFDDDPVLGISDLDQYYIDYFSQEGITGPTTDIAGDGSGAGWEQTHRILLGLLTPTKYNASIRNGKKQLVITYSSTAIDPHTLLAGAFIPLRPTAVSYVGTQTKITTPGNLPIPRSVGNETLAGYFIVGPTIARAQARVYNERLGTTILSNIIQLEVRVPPSMDGTVLIENLNTVQRTALFGGPGPTSGTLPLGFRLRSNGFNLAAALDGLTYLDVNRPTEVMGHAFTVVDDG